MGRNNWFEFKQFRIEQQRSAMKVGTDGVLLGSWAAVKDTRRILDVGTGTGLIALMVAQRSEARIDAVEIDAAASEEATHNFRKSAWSERLNLINADFLQFAGSSDCTYDLIVSNPPFFVNSVKTNDAALSVARHNDMLSFNQLILGARKLLASSGRLCVILPTLSFVEFRENARLSGFYLHHLTTVIPKPGKVPKRILMEFSLDAGYPDEDSLTIMDSDGGYTLAYKTLTSPFYPAF